MRRAGPGDVRWAREGASGCLVALAATLLSLLLLEVVTRATGLRRPTLGTGSDRRLWVYDASKGWFHRPGTTGRVFVSGPDQALVRINSLGLRGPEVSLLPGRRAPRVLVLGDSFVFGLGVDQEHLMTAHLQRFLTATEGHPVEVVNAGVAGYATDQELILFRELGPRLRPDLVILVMCDNDFEENLEDFVYHRYYKPRFRLSNGRLVLEGVPVPRLSRAQSARLWMAERSNLWNLLRATPAFARDLEVGESSPSEQDPMALMLALTREFAGLARTLGAGFLTANTGHRGEHTELFQQIRPRLAAAGIRFVGLEKALGEARWRDPERDWDFPGDTHWNVDSERLAARVIHSELRHAGW
jgi:GDSL-like Lipase/Acylhydrolase family